MVDNFLLKTRNTACTRRYQAAHLLSIYSKPRPAPLPHPKILLMFSGGQPPAVGSSLRTNCHGQNNFFVFLSLGKLCFSVVMTMKFFKSGHVQIVRMHTVGAILGGRIPVLCLCELYPGCLCFGRILLPTCSVILER